MIPSTSTNPNAYTTIPAERAALIRPCDLAGHQALHQLARLAHARIQRGHILLARRARPAWLAITSSGRVLCAVLIGEENSANRENSEESREG